MKVHAEKSNKPVREDEHSRAIGSGNMIGNALQLISQSNPQSQKLNQYQQMADNSLQSKQAAQLKSMVGGNGVIQRCISPESIGKGKKALERIDEMEVYFKDMLSKMEDKGYQLAQIDENEKQVLGEKWYSLKELFDKETEQFDNARKFVTDPNSTEAAVEAIEGLIEMVNEAYSQLKSGELQSETQKLLNNTEMKRAEKDRPVSEHNPIVRGMTLPGKSDVPKEIKGVQRPNGIAVKFIRDICLQMAALKGALLHDDVNAHEEWFALYNRLVDFLFGHFKEDPESYLGLIRLKVIETIQEAPKMLDRGEMCNEELPKAIIAILKG